MRETVTDLVSKLERAHSAFCEALVELGETDRLDERPQPGEWNAREVAAHQMTAERWMRGVAANAQGAAGPPFDAPFPEGEIGFPKEIAGQPLTALVRLLESERELTLVLLAHSSDADLTRPIGPGPSGEQLTLGGWLTAIAGHESRHTAQLGAMLRGRQAP